MKALVVISVLLVGGCASPGAVSFDSAVIQARPVTGGQYDINIQGYSRKTPAKVTK